MHRTSRLGLRAVPCALLCAFSAPPAQADTALGETIVSANRREVNVDGATVTVSKLGREQIDRRIPIDDADLFPDEPDVAMARDLRRFGATRVNIRGIEDNRAVQLVDGFRLPDYYNGGGATNFTMSATPGVMPDFLRQAEVVRGPASSLYGSDALGGVVGYLTISPRDIASGDKKTGLHLRGTWSSASDTAVGSVIGAMRGDTLELLLGYAQGSGEGRRQDSRTDILRIPSSLPRISQMLGDDSAARMRASLEYEHRASGPFYDRLTLRAHLQDAENHNANQQVRSNTTAGCSGVSGGVNTCRIDQDFYFEQQNLGLGAQFESGFLLDGHEHLLTYGLDLSRQEVSSKRDATIRNLTTGTVSKTLAGETYPLHHPRLAMHPLAESDCRSA